MAEGKPSLPTVIPKSKDPQHPMPSNDMDATVETSTTQVAATDPWPGAPWAAVSDVREWLVALGALGAIVPQIQQARQWVASEPFLESWPVVISLAFLMVTLMRVRRNAKRRIAKASSEHKVLQRNRQVQQLASQINGASERVAAYSRVQPENRDPSLGPLPPFGWVLFSDAQGIVKASAQTIVEAFGTQHPQGYRRREDGELHVKREALVEWLASAGPEGQ